MLRRRLSPLLVLIPVLAVSGVEPQPGGAPKPAQPGGKAQPNPPADRVKEQLAEVDKKIDGEIKDLVALYQHIHANPELSLQEVNTAKRLAETTIQARINKYTTHIAFHLYQMYLKKREMQKHPGYDAFSDEQMRDEIQRVSRTLIELMEVSQ